MSITDRTDYFLRVQHLKGNIDYFENDERETMKGKRSTTKTSKGELVKTSGTDVDYLRKIAGQR